MYGWWEWVWVSRGGGRGTHRGRDGKVGKGGEWGHVLSFLNWPVVYGWFKSESDPIRETLLSHDVPHSRASLTCFSFFVVYLRLMHAIQGPTSGRTSVSIHPTLSHIPLLSYSYSYSYSLHFSSFNTTILSILISPLPKLSIYLSKYFYYIFS